MRYPGSKNAPGTYHVIINQIPPHTAFIEGFAGSAAITRHKRAAATNILIDRNEELIEGLYTLNEAEWRIPNLMLIPECFLAWARDSEMRFLLRERKTFLYLDPPYLRKTRRQQQRPLYEHEFWTVKQHTELLKFINRLRGYVMISAYRNSLYDRLLRSWRRLDYHAILRSGERVVESLYMNYDEPDRLHDYSYVGAGYRKRQDIRRQQRRWAARLLRMPRVQALAMMEVIERVFTIDDSGDSADDRSGPRRPRRD